MMPFIYTTTTVFLLLVTTIKCNTSYHNLALKFHHIKHTENLLAQNRIFQFKLHPFTKNSFCILYVNYLYTDISYQQIQKIHLNWS